MLGRVGYLSIMDLQEQISLRQCNVVDSNSEVRFKGMINVVILDWFRLYAVYKEGGFIEDFEEMIENIFQPLFEVTQDPTTHPQLHVFLSQVRRMFRNHMQPHFPHL